MIFKPNVAILPWWKIRNEIENLWITQEEFAERLWISQKHLSQLINWKVSLTKEVTNKLDLVTWIPASFWNKLENAYQEDKARIEFEQKQQEELNLVSKFTCYPALKIIWTTNRGWESMKGC